MREQRKKKAAAEVEVGDAGCLLKRWKRKMREVSMRVIQEILNFSSTAATEAKADHFSKGVLFGYHPLDTAKKKKAPRT